MSVQYSDRDGKPDPKLKFDTWEDWVEYHDNYHRQMLEKVSHELGKSIGQFVLEQIKPLKKRIAELEAAQANFGYRGVWNVGSEYRQGNFVTVDGSLFHCNMTTKNRPGKDPVSWTL